MEWRDIPKIERWGKSFTIPWNSLEQQLAIYEKEAGLDLDPDFQRGHVWSHHQQVKYVEYVLREGNLNRHIIFNCPSFFEGNIEGPMLLLDGKQRLQAARLFLANKLPVFDGLYRKDFTRQGKPSLLIPSSLSFTFYVNDLQNRADVLQFYLDLNAGGVVHSETEIDRVQQLLAIERGDQNTKTQIDRAIALIFDFVKKRKNAESCEIIRELETNGIKIDIYSLAFSGLLQRGLLTKCEYKDGSNVYFVSS